MSILRPETSVIALFYKKVIVVSEMISASSVDFIDKQGDSSSYSGSSVVPAEHSLYFQLDEVIVICLFSCRTTLLEHFLVASFVDILSR